jgi:GNAT superfamily N-acetyltransferase
MIGMCAFAIAAMEVDDRARVCDALRSLGDLDFSDEADELESLPDDSGDPEWAGRYVAHKVGARAQLLGYISGRRASQYWSYVPSPPTSESEMAVATIIFVWAEATQVRQGIATSLMKQLVDYLIGEGCTYLTLSINGNLSASGHASKDLRLDLAARSNFVTRRCRLEIFSQFPIIAGGPLGALQQRLQRT